MNNLKATPKIYNFTKKQFKSIKTIKTNIHNSYITPLKMYNNKNNNNLKTCFIC